MPLASAALFTSHRLSAALVTCLQWLAIAAAAALCSACQATSQDWEGVERVVAVGDIHGDYDNYIKVLQQAGIVDGRKRWAAGETHLVQLGDIPDRGPDTAKIIRHLRGLESQAEQAGGRVHALIGNHEAMNITGDLRYVHPGEYEALQSRNARELRDRYYERVISSLEAAGKSVEDSEAFRERWLKSHPLGYVEHRQHWHPDGEFGSWVTAHSALLRINRTLFVHGGVSPEIGDRSLEDLNESIRAALRTVPATEAPLLNATYSPLWYRDLARGEETEALAAHLDTMLAHYDVDRIVVGHTPGFATIVPRYGGRFIVADSGISKHYGGHLASLLIENGRLFTVQRGERIPFPTSDPELLPYYRAVNDVEPGVNNLRYMIQQLEKREND